MNTTAINQSWINSWPVPSSLTEGGFSLNWFNLCWDGVVTNFPDRFDNNYNLNTQANPFIDGSILLSRLLNEKTVTLELFINKDTKAELHEKIDELKQKLSVEEKILSFPYELPTETETRQIVLSQASFTFSQWETATTNINCTIVLQATSTPRRYSKALESKTYSGITTSFNGDINNPWSAKTYPEYYFVFGAVSWLTSVEIVIDGYTLAVNNTFNTNDVLVVDTEVGITDKGFVKLNGVKVDYDGRLDTPLQPGTNIVNFNFTGGTSTCNLSVIFKKTYE